MPTMLVAYVSAALHKLRRVSRLACMGMSCSANADMRAGCLRTWCLEAGESGLDWPLGKWLIVRTCAEGGRVCTQQQ